MSVSPYYSEGGVTLYHGDCREVLPTLGVCADHLVTDPPYQISGEHSDEHRRDGSTRKHNFSWDLDPACREIDEGIIAAIAAVRRPANVIIWCGHGQISRFDVILREEGMSTKPLAWVKQCPPPSFGVTRWASGFEMAVFGFDAGATWNLRESGMRPNTLRCEPDPPNVLTCDAMRHGNPEKNGHQTQKPMRLMRWQLDGIALPGQTILDVYAGSGTTLVAARDGGMNAIGIEREEQWCEVAANRLRQGVLFGVETGAA